MKTTFTVLFFLLGSMLVYPFSGSITSDTTWATNVIVTGNVTVEAGFTLTIMPGVIVTFPMVDQNADGIGDTKFIINGRLISQGIPSSHVVFKSNQATPSKKDWAGIIYQTPQAGQLSTLSYTDIQNAYQGFTLNGRNVTFNYCTISDCADYGMFIQSTLLTTSINNSTIQTCGSYGLTVTAGSVTIAGLNIYKCGANGFKMNSGANVNANNLISSTNDSVGIYVSNNTTGTFTDCRSISNKVDGILVESSTPSFTNCDFSNNGRDGVKLTGSTSNPIFVRCNINSNSRNGFHFEDGTKAMVTYSKIINNYREGIWLVNALSTFNYNNIYNNGVPGSENYSLSFNYGDWMAVATTTNYPINIIPKDAIYLMSLTYKKDGDYRSGGCNVWWYYRNWSKINVDASYYLADEFNSGYLSQCATYDMSEITVAGNVNQLWLPGKTLSVQVYNTENCTNARAWVTSLTYSLNHYARNLSAYILSGNANFQYNWWGQINFVDTLVYQLTANTINYSQYQTQTVAAAGCILTNIAPVFSVSSPASILSNPSSVTINYSATDLDDNASVKFYYKKSLSDAGTLITTISEDGNSGTYTWGLTGVAKGTYYIVGTINDGTNSIQSVTAAGRVIVGGLNIYTPLTNSGIAGGAIKVPITTINSVAPYNIIAYQFTLSFNPSLLTATGVTFDSTLSANWTVNYNNATPGQITVNGFSTTPLDAEGTLVYINFTANASAANYTNCVLTFADVKFNNGTPTATITDGKFTVVNKYSIAGQTKYYYTPFKTMGSVNLSLADTVSTYTNASDASGVFTYSGISAGSYTLSTNYAVPPPALVVTPYDAALTAQFAVSLIAFSTDQQKAADVNNDGAATVYDAALIAQYSVGLISAFDAGIWKFNPVSKAYTLTSNYTSQVFSGICIGDPSGNWFPPVLQNEKPITPAAVKGLNNYSGTITVPVKTSQQFISAYIKMNYDTTQIRFKEVVYSDAIKGMSKYANDKSGSICIAAYGVNPVQSDKDVMQLVFETTQPVANDNALSVEFVQFDDKNETITAVKTEGNGTMPVSYNLMQNYPNPFNPSTVINFSIAKEANVQLRVYNALGTEVRTLCSERKSAGNYSLNFNAAGLASGVYFYKLTAGEFTSIKKMTFVK